RFQFPFRYDLHPTYRSRLLSLRFGGGTRDGFDKAAKRIDPVADGSSETEESLSAHTRAGNSRSSKTSRPSRSMKFADNKTRDHAARSDKSRPALGLPPCKTNGKTGGNPPSPTQRRPPAQNLRPRSRA